MIMLREEVDLLTAMDKLSKVCGMEICFLDEYIIKSFKDFSAFIPVSLIWCTTLCLRRIVPFC